MLDQIKDKYKSLPIWARLLMVLIIGILPGACSYLDEAESLEQTLSDSQTVESNARGKFEANRKEKANIPILEEQLAYTEDQLEKAKKKLPEGYLIENILALTAANSKEAGVRLLQFDPSCELKGEAEFKYVEFPIDVEISGKFQQIAFFLDKMVHSESMIFIREIDINRGASENVERRGATEARELSEFDLADRARRDLRLSAKFKLVVFRGMKDEEEAFFENRTSCDSLQNNAIAMPPANQPPPPPPPVDAGARTGTTEGQAAP